MINSLQKTGEFSTKANICDSRSLECWQLEEFLINNRFISEAHRTQYNALFGGPKFYWDAFPNLYKRCSEKRKVPYRCKTDYCRSNNPNGIYFFTKECELKNQIEMYKFLRDLYCGKLQKKFFKL